MKLSPKKAEAVHKITVPKNEKESKSFMGMTNHCWDLWMRRTDPLAPPSDLTRKMSKCTWIEKHAKAFKAVEQVSNEAQLQCPDFTKPFEMHADTSEHQSGAVIALSDEPTAFFSRKLNESQWNHGIVTASHGRNVEGVLQCTPGSGHDHAR